MSKIEPGFRSRTGSHEQGTNLPQRHTPFGIANGKCQIPKYGICNLRSVIPSASEDSLLQVCPSSLFNRGIRVEVGQMLADLAGVCSRQLLRRLNQRSERLFKRKFKSQQHQTQRRK